MTVYRPPVYADERNGGPIINCVAASGVNISRAATNGAIPASDAEVKALRKATGDIVGGQTLRQLQTGLRNRYGFTGYLADNWTAYTNGFAGKGWFAALGWLHSLPRRCWSQPTDVFHCIAVTGAGQGFVDIIDPLQKPRPVAQRITVDEFRTFASSGGYASLRLDEFSEVPHVSVYCRTILASTFIYQANPWKRHRAFGVQFTARCTKAEWLIVLGKRRQMVEILTGPHTRDWLDIAASHITYSEAP